MKKKGKVNVNVNVKKRVVGKRLEKDKGLYHIDKIDSKRGRKNIWLLGGSSLINDIGSESITPLLPFYIASLGGGGVSLGLVAGLREGLASLFKLFGGWFSDRLGKRNIFIFIGYFLSIIFRFLLGVAGSWHQVIGFVSFERLGKIRDAPRDAIISQSIKKRGRGFGIHQMMDAFGGIIGSLLVLILFWKLGLSIKSIIFIAAGVSVLSLIPLAFVKEPKFNKTRKGLFEGVKELDPRLKYFIFVAGVFTLANFGWFLFLIKRISDITGSVAIGVGSYILFNVLFAFSSIPFGKLSDKIGRKSVLFLGYLLALIVSVGFIILDGLIFLIGLFAIYGLVYAIMNSVQRAFVSDLAGDMKGTAMGFYYLIIGLVNIPGGLIAGYLWDFSPDLMFKYIAGVTLLAILLLIFVKEGKEFKR